MNPRLHILVADDQAQLLSDFIATELGQTNGMVIDIAINPADVVSKIMSNQYDLILLDISFTTGKREGLDVLPEIRSIDPNCAIVMLSSFDDRATIKRAMDLGATNYVVKTHEDNFHNTIQCIKSAIAKRQFAQLTITEGRALAKAAGAVFHSSRSDDVLAKIARARRAASTNVLITGPTGAGKDAVARSIARQDEGRPFVVVNCASLTPTLVESEFFGYVKGAFTGAVRDTRGLFESANGGDIFLDEVACLPLKAQAALLRVLQSGEFNPVGSSTTRKVIVRLIAATNEDLNQAVKIGTFREDLLARLKHGFSIVVPPLRERREDIWPIIQHTIACSLRPMTQVTAACREFLESHSWPTNVRGLIGTVNQMLLLTNEAILDVSDIPKDILSDVDCEVGIDRGQNEPLIASDQDCIQMEFPANVSLDSANLIFLKRFIEIKIASLLPPRSVSSLAIALGVPRPTLIRRMRDLSINFDAIASTAQHTKGN